MKIFPLLAWILFSFPVLGGADTIPARVTGNNVNLRIGPSRHAEIVGQVPQGTEVRVVLTDGEWSAILPPAGTAGWIAQSYLEDGVVTGSRVNLRAGPSVAYVSLMILEEGAEVSLLEEVDGWAKIDLPETVRLWMSSRYLSSGTEPVSPVLPMEPPPATARAPLPPPIEEPARRAVPRIPEEPVPAARSAAVPTSPAPRSYTGFIRELEQPLSLADREYGYELAESRHVDRPIAFLTGETVDLSSYRFRRVRLWAETIEARSGHPALLEVKGVGFLW
ncbi:MAG: SH3 domain-containing protein [Candidatus Erginobacter occultus]|nr:SH3 domain-containing protein [Candidatus Erginobacter occultus]